jgi:hypothetical protein
MNDEMLIIDFRIILCENCSIGRDGLLPQLSLYFSTRQEKRKRIQFFMKSYYQMGAGGSQL